MKLSQKQIFIVYGLAILFLILLFFFYYNLQSRSRPPKIILTVWGFDKETVFEPLFQAYHQLRPNVSIKYDQISSDNYETTLLNALASGQGPDVFPIFNRSLPQNENKLSPVNPNQLNLIELRDDFPQVVEDDFAVVSGTPDNKRIYALPLSVDTLALFYNRDLFDQANIVSPPKTWDDFQNIIALLRSINPSGQIVQAAAAIGGSENTIPNAVDILNNLMLQNRTQMVNADSNSATFATDLTGPGIQAFNFYLEFANPISPYYTWSDNGSVALDSFASGKTAMIFDYSSALNSLKAKSPFLNFAVAPMPQPSGSNVSLTYAKYWGWAVSKQSLVSAWAWDFIIYATTNPDMAKTYFNNTNQPPALLSLIQNELNDPDYAVFAKGALTARSWYEVDAEAINQIFNQAIAGVLNGQFNSSKALQNAQDQITQLMQKNTQ